MNNETKFTPLNIGEEYIRRRLGLSDQDIVTDAHVFEAFEIRQHLGLTN